MSSVNPESFVKLPIVIAPLPDSANLFALIVPVCITSPSIEVTFAFTSPACIGVFVLVPSDIVLALLNVTSPLNPIACLTVPKVIV